MAGTSILEIVESQRPSLVNEDQDARIEAIKKINQSVLQLYYYSLSNRL